MRQLRDAIRRAGIDVRRTDVRSPLESYLGLLVDELHIQHVVDVGANTGQFGRSVRSRVGFSGRLDSYEPGREAYASLQAAAAGDPRWFTHHAALTTKAGPVTLHVFSSSDLSSLSEPSDVGRASVGFEADWRSTAETVEGRKLDDEVLPDLGPTFLKLDTQGHDWTIIESAPALLGRVELLMTELSFVPLYESSVSAQTTIGHLDAMGFGLAHLEPIGRVSGGHALLEADGLFVRRPRRV